MKAQDDYKNLSRDLRVKSEILMGPRQAGFPHAGHSGKGQAQHSESPLGSPDERVSLDAACCPCRWHVEHMAGADRRHPEPPLEQNQTVKGALKKEKEAVIPRASSNTKLVRFSMAGDEDDPGTPGGLGHDRSTLASENGTEFDSIHNISGKDLFRSFRFEEKERAPFHERFKLFDMIGSGAYGKAYRAKRLVSLVCLPWSLGWLPRTTERSGWETRKSPVCINEDLHACRGSPGPGP